MINGEEYSKDQKVQKAIRVAQYAERKRVEKDIDCVCRTRIDKVEYVELSVLYDMLETKRNNLAGELWGD